jgi:hypothetical protein
MPSFVWTEFDDTYDQDPLRISGDMILSNR